QRPAANASVGLRARSRSDRCVVPRSASGQRVDGYSVWRCCTDRASAAQLAAFREAGAAYLQRVEHWTAGSRSRAPAGEGRKEISFALHRRAEYAAVSVWIWSVLHNVQLRSDAGQRKTNISFSTRTRVRRKKQTCRGAFRERRN